MPRTQTNEKVTWKMKIKTGDTVLIIAGKDKGERGRVIGVNREKQTVLVEGLTKDKEGHAIPLNAMIKHRKAVQGQPGEKLRKPSPLHVSNVMLIDPHTDEPTRVGKKLEGGKLVRISKNSGKIVDTD